MRYRNIKNQLWFAIISIVMFGATQVFASGITIFPSVQVMVEDFADYSVSNGSFHILKATPLHIQLSPQVTKGEDIDVIEGQVKRALLYGIYRSFIHTSIDKITVTVIPKELDFTNMRSKYLTKYAQTVSITRKNALNWIKKYTNAAKYSDLVTDVRVGKAVYHNQWSKNFKNIYYSNQGKFSLKHIVKGLSRNN